MTIDQELLRETRDDLVERVTDQQEKMGLLRSTRQAEDFVDPILNKVDIADDMKRPAPASKLDRDREGGEWYGEAEHSARVPEAREGIGERVSLKAREIGSVIVDKASGTITSASVPSDDTPLIQKQIRALMSHPEWAEAFRLLSGVCGTHVICQKTCTLCQRREASYGRLIAQAYRRYGNPEAPAESRLILSGPVRGVSL